MQIQLFTNIEDFWFGWKDDICTLQNKSFTNEKLSELSNIGICNFTTAGNELENRLRIASKINYKYLKQIVTNGNALKELILIYGKS